MIIRISHNKLRDIIITSLLDLDVDDETAETVADEVIEATRDDGEVDEVEE